MKLTFFSALFLSLILIFLGIMIDRQFLIKEPPETEIIPIIPPLSGHIEKELVVIEKDSTIALPDDEIMTSETNIIADDSSAVRTLYGVVKADSNIVGTKIKIDSLEIDIKVDKLKNRIYVDWIKYYERIRYKEYDKKSIIGTIGFGISDKKRLSISGSVGFPKILNNVLLTTILIQEDEGISLFVGLSYLFY